MLTPIRNMALLAAFCAAGISLAAQPALKVATVDLSRIYDEYWKSQDHEGKLYKRQLEDQAQIDELQKSLQAAADEIRKLEEESKSPLLSQDAKSRITNDLNRKLQDARQANGQLQQYVANAERYLQQQRSTFQNIVLDEITRVALSIGQGRGATIILDTSGPTQIGISSILYADPGYDITDAVIAELNKSKPEGWVAPEIPAQ